MRILIIIIVTALFAAVLEYFFPWWTIAIAAFAVAFVTSLRPGKAFLTAFAGIFLLWLLVALVKDSVNDHLLSGRMAALFKLPNGFTFIVIAAVLGGIAGGLAGWSGATVRTFFKRR